MEMRTRGASRRSTPRMKATHLLMPRLWCSSRSCTMAGYMPMLELLMKMRPLSSPTSSAWATGNDRLYCSVEVEWNADVLGEVIERAERQHTERGRRAGDRSGDSAHRPVAAGSDDGAAAAFRIAAGDWRQLAAVSDDDRLGLGTVLAEQRRDVVGQLSRPVGPGTLIDNARNDGLSCQLVHADHPPHQWVLNTAGSPLVPNSALTPSGACQGRVPGQFETQSAHFTGAVPSPHGLMGTADVEFSGLPSMILSV